MELIDRNNINVIELEDSSHIIRHEKGDEIDWYIDAPTVKAIPLDKVKQAREEIIKEYSYSLSCFSEDAFDEDEIVVDLDDVLIILDKLIAESEG